MLNIKLNKKSIKQLATSNRLDNKMTPLINGAGNTSIWESPVESKYHMSCEIEQGCRTARGDTCK
ncbi:hypothetical protein CBQ28_17375 [Pseudoalteromonas sp. GCY]|uniref:hypothetical protein n=1 Tax=Pseudoalteromonas sp. GCY TaxID=2003316 RepID=UPI000BFEB504|nr:hypothetical protein [Pseudoalteromonas sp. GCY]PHI35857.1 hypothetical protein CBQ28_17375 [Pseudoalteromonas sp. GCY]QQQ68209.1 hypothetical protein JJQ94_10585 [Pseudoalteromonas sp. GCY]